MNIANGISGKLIFRAPIAQCAEIEAIAKELKRPVSELLREALAQALPALREKVGTKQEASA